jgi:hypothetical protein
VLIQLESYDRKLLELLDKMDEALQTVKEVRDLPSSSEFHKTRTALKPIIEETGNLLLKYQRHGQCVSKYRSTSSNEKFLGLSFRKELAAYDSIMLKFDAWNHRFVRGMAVEEFKRLAYVEADVHDLADAQKREADRQRRAELLESLRPCGTDRERPITGCLEGTREGILREIETWRSTINLTNILWIKGFPGSGKTSIAQSIVEKLADRKHMHSSFFFQRDSAPFTAPSTLIRTIVYELSRQSELFLDAVVAELQTQEINFGITSVDQQFCRLVKNPLRHLATHSPGQTVVVVIDALNECGGLGISSGKDRDDLLSAIARWARFSPWLKLIITSRDERFISQVLAPISTSLELRLDSHRGSKDVAIFLRHEFKKIAHNHGLVGWPESDQILALAQKAKGLFVWAATLVKFVDQPRPQDVLAQIVAGDTELEGDITKLYVQILRISFSYDPSRPLQPRFLAEFKATVGAIVTAKHPLERQSPLLHILEVEPTTVTYICDRLRSVLIKTEVLRFHHQSFVDFLISDTCPENFRINPFQIKESVSLAILKFMDRHLRFNPCGLETSYLSTTRLDARTLSSITPHLSYACQKWSDALWADNAGSVDILAALRTFFETKLLYWLEVLSLMGTFSLALVQLNSAKGWIGVSLPLCSIA